MRIKILALVMLFSTCSFSQEGFRLKEETEKPFIEVIGTATKFVTPDKIYLSITLTDKLVDKKNYTIDEQEAKLKSSLAKLNIDTKNLFLSDSNLEITRRKFKETGYKVSKDFTLILKNADEVSKVFKELNDIDIKEASITKCESSEIELHRKEVRIAAIKAAKEKAIYLLEAIGEKLDKPLEVKEENMNNYKSNSLHSNGYVQSKDYDEISFEKIEVKFSYYVKYAIK